MEQILVDLFGNALISKIIVWAGLIVTIATAITSVLPSLHDNKVFNIILKVLNFIAGNFGKNVNADAIEK